MPQYNFSSLSPQDFEELVRDLLQAEWGVSLESFKAGRDNGIDLRYATADDGETIIQCKHYVMSGFRNLVTNLKNKELPKVSKLRPKRYVVVTSCGLTPANKDTIIEVMRPYIQKTSDIYGAQELEGQLRNHPAVEKANFKLWLTSTTMLERVLHNAELCHTDFTVQQIRPKLQLFVQSSAFPRAKELLDETRIVIISGIPGIGKTTLAEMLLYEHLALGYQPVVILGSVSEGRKFFNSKEKQIFYFDDFLGQTFLGDRKEYIGRNEDAAIVNFMEMIQYSKCSRFILTTREHILSSALQVSERSAHSLHFQNKCVIELEDYSYIQKARILYNHLYFSDLPQQYRDAVVKDRFFLGILKHQHFNPRLIEWLSTYNRLMMQNVPAEKYREHISGLLDNPEKIWMHAFKNQISNSARHTLLVLYTVEQWINTSDLEPLFAALRIHWAEKYNGTLVADEFHTALQELDGAFLTFSRDRVNFLNPTIREFVESVIVGNRDFAKDLLLSANYFRQISILWHLAKAQKETVLYNVFCNEHNCLLDILLRLIEMSYLQWKEGDLEWNFYYYRDIEFESKIGLLMEIATLHRSSHIAELAVRATQQHTEDGIHGYRAFNNTMELFAEISKNTWFLEHGGREIYRVLLDGLFNEISPTRATEWLATIELHNNALDWTESDEERFRIALESYRNSGVYLEMSNYDTSDALSKLKDSLKQLAHYRGFKFKSAIREIEQQISKLEDFEYEEDDSFSEWRSMSSDQVMADEDVSEMFNTLRES